MTVLLALIPVSLSLGLLGLVAFVWSLKARQYDDLEGDQYRALFGRDDRAPGPGSGPKHEPAGGSRDPSRRPSD